MSRPSGKIGRDTSSFENTCSSVTFCRPAAIASSVLPVPALPTSVTQLDVVVEQQVEREVLLLVARLDPPHALAQLLDRDRLAAVLSQRVSADLPASSLSVQELVRVQRRRVDDDRALRVERVDRAGRHEQLAVARVQLLDRDLLGLVSRPVCRPSASPRTRMLTSLVTRIVGVVGSASRTSSAISRMR